MAGSEATILGRYLIGQTPTTDQITRYEKAAARLPAIDNRLLQQAWLIPYVDAYDALFRPSSSLRGRLYILFSILESSTEFADSFLPSKTSFFGIIGPGIRAVWSVLIGIIVVKIGRV